MAAHPASTLRVERARRQNGALPSAICYVPVVGAGVIPDNLHGVGTSSREVQSRGLTSFGLHPRPGCPDA